MIAAARASGLSGGTSRPVVPWSIRAPRPVTREAMPGIDRASAAPACVRCWGRGKAGSKGRAPARSRAEGREIDDADVIGNPEKLGVPAKVERAFALPGDQKLGVPPGVQDHSGGIEEAGEPRAFAGQSGCPNHRDLRARRAGNGGTGRDAGTDHADPVSRESEPIRQSESQVRARNDEFAKPAQAQPDAPVQDGEVIHRLDVGHPPGVGRRAPALPSPRESHAASAHAGSRTLAEAGESRATGATGFPSRGAREPGGRRGPRPSGHADHTHHHAAEGKAVQERDERPSVIVQTQSSGEEHNFDEVIHGSARPRQRDRGTVPQSVCVEQVRAEAGVGIDAIMVYTEPLQNSGPGKSQPGLSVTHEFKPDGRTGLSRPP